MSRRRGRGTAAVALVLGTLLAASAWAQDRPLIEGDAAHVRVRHAGNEALARRRVAVTCRTLEELGRLLQAAFPAHAAAVRVTRAAPRERVEYVLCLLADGTLVAGAQTHRLDAAGEASGASRGEIAAAHQPLERPGPPAWLVPVPLTREATVLLEVRAEGPGPMIETMGLDVRVVP